MKKVEMNIFISVMGKEFCTGLLYKIHGVIQNNNLMHNLMFLLYGSLNNY